MVSSKIFAAAALASIASAIDHQVKVGSGGNVYSPSTIPGVAVGDTVSFQFQGTVHNVVQSSFSSPCTPMDNGFSVPFQSSSDTFTVNVTTTDAIWFYCSYQNHCNLGMVGVINPGTGQTQGAFASAAKGATVSQPKSNSAVGGVLGSG
ncbi:hypothetical protein BT63DRAFT_384073 [Microthyrium microscopicum]|uniref:Phytocyanin domain-containing protein n=1 Tax=Microthyrium microscopicum TaxID=703497 RepID=A0A6A6URF2_9PEZI|nr:hypothetical protein BT63DRAFT_384073 [Microthyrium microscopicum]